MEHSYRDIFSCSSGGSDLQEVRKRLRSMPEEDMMLELCRITEEARQKGERLDPHMTLLYYKAMDDLHPIPIPPKAKMEAKSRFALRHPEYMAPPSAAARRDFFRLPARRAVMAAVLAGVFALGSAAAAFDLPQQVIAWGKETFHIHTGRGEDMGPDVSAEDGFSTLEDALSFYGVSACTPRWIPSRFQLDSVSVNEAESWTSFLAVYRPTDGSADSCVVKIMYHSDPQQVPDLIYEDDGAEDREIRTVGDLTLQITKNNTLCRISWQSDTCASDMMGTFSQDEVNAIIDHIQ